MLGQALLTEAAQRGRSAIGLGSSELDIRDRPAVLAVIGGERPQQIINCAALTAVDACEARREDALEVNGSAVVNIINAARSVGAALIQVSTDFVFDGTSPKPYGEKAEPAPLSVYGESKRLGELATLEYERGLVVRTSWLFGPGGANFVATMAGLIAEGRKPLRVVGDQIGCPTYTPYLARAIWDLLELRINGVVHYRNRHPVSWHAFACEIASLLDDPEEVVSISSEELARPAPRPAYSVLDVSKFERLVGRQVENWKEGLIEYLTMIRGRRRS